MTRNSVTIFFVVLILGTVTTVSFSSAFFGFPVLFPIMYKIDQGIEPAEELVSVRGDVTTAAEEALRPIRMATPEAVRAIYMTQCVVGTPSFRDKLVRIAETTEINAIVIDIKDFTGRLGFIPDDPILRDSLSQNCYAPDMKEFIRMLNEKGIYVIGRITVFQDPYYAQKRPDLAVLKESDRSTWKDYKGLSFIDAGSQEMWDYIVAISKEAYDIGFDELNYDYIRFPSDGDLTDIFFPFSEDHITANPDTGKADIIEEFFAYLHGELKNYESYKEEGLIRKSPSENKAPKGPALSADLFGMVTTNTDDLNIGQVLERALPYFDYIAPMVYPSHYPRGFNGWQNPNNHVYGVVKYSLDSAVERLSATTTTVETLYNVKSLSTTTLIFAKETYTPNVLRPWLQDFDYGGDYGIEEVRAQIQAAYDAGINSWMLWDPSNRYTLGALEKEEVEEENKLE